MNNFLKRLDALFTDLFLKKAPPLPKNIQEGLVKILPWLVLIFSLLALPGIIAGLGLSTTVPFWVLNGTRHINLLFGFLISFIQVAVGLLAVPHLLQKAKKGWILLYYALLLSLLSSAFYFSGIGIIMTIVFLYFLYQLKENYH
jgi:Na+/melibiose symporter-like transporter